VKHVSSPLRNWFYIRPHRSADNSQNHMYEQPRREVKSEVLTVESRLLSSGRFGRWAFTFRRKLDIRGNSVHNINNMCKTVRRHNPDDSNFDMQWRYLLHLCIQHANISLFAFTKAGNRQKPTRRTCTSLVLLYDVSVRICKRGRKFQLWNRSNIHFDRIVDRSPLIFRCAIFELMFSCG
jgi:hypothetical protein